MKPIQPVGKIKEEPKKSRRDRSSMAYKMTVDGTNSQSAFIDMIDSKVKSRKTEDKLSEAVKIAIASSDDKKYTITMQDILGAFKSVFENMYDGSKVSSLFNTSREEFDSFDTLASSLKEKYKGKKKPVLNSTQKTQFDILANGFIKDWKIARDNLIVQTTDRLLENIRTDVLARLNIDEENNYPIVISKRDHVFSDINKCNCGSCGDSCKSDEKRCVK